MLKKYIKMNDNKNYLSLGNVFNIINNISVNRKKVMQLDLFLLLFDAKEASIKTVNNYCIGYSAIGVEYKNIYISLKEEYEKNKYVFIKIVSPILGVLDNKNYNYSKEDINLINTNERFILLCNRLFDLARNDKNIDINFINEINNYFIVNNYYDAFIKFLFYAVLENKQPIYLQNIKEHINKTELEEYMRIKLFEGDSYITSLVRLANKNNVYACAELGSLEYSGSVSGFKDYQKSYEYYLKASAKNHPKACSMVAKIILDGKIENASEKYDIAWLYLNRAASLGSAAALNSIGNAYLNGKTPDKIKDASKAKEYFTLSSELGYSYAYNNLGIMYEKEGNVDEAIKYYKISADLGESWALNKVGEYYRKLGNRSLAYLYYLKSSESPISERNFYSYYNLAKYYYLRSKKTKDKGIEYLKIASSHGIKKAKELLKKYDFEY